MFLYDLYKSEPFAQNPFAAVFVKYLQVRTNNAVKRPTGQPSLTLARIQVSEEDTEQRLAAAADESDTSAPVESPPRLSPSEKQFLAQLVTGQMTAQQAKGWFRKSAPLVSSQFPPGSGDVDLSGIQAGAKTCDIGLQFRGHAKVSLGSVRGPTNTYYSVVHITSPRSSKRALFTLKRAAVVYAVRLKCKETMAN